MRISTNLINLMNILFLTNIIEHYLILNVVNYYHY